MNDIKKICNATNLKYLAVARKKKIFQKLAEFMGFVSFFK